MFGLNTKVVIKKSVEKFHYSETPRYSLVRVLENLRKRGIYGIVRDINKDHNAVAVQFPKMQDFIWFKAYELQSLREGR